MPSRSTFIVAPRSAGTALGASAAICLLAFGCSSPEKADSATGGATGTGGDTSSGGMSGTTSAGTGGLSQGGNGVGGANVGGTTSGGTSGGGTTSGGTDGGGTTSGGSGGSGAVATGGTGAVAGAGAMGGAGGTGGAGVTGGTAGTSVGGAGSGDSYVSGVMVTVHPTVRTILVVTWTQMTAADDTHLEFTFENGVILRSRAKPGATGAHRDVVLGVPGSTLVTIRIVSRAAGVSYPTRDYMGTTGAIPGGLPVASGVMHDAMRASPERYLFGSVEDSKGGCGPSCYNQWVYWTYIMDRKGRMVWYYSDPASNATSSFQRVARDGEYIWIEKRPYGRAGTHAVLKMTLDGEYREEIPIPDLADAIDVTTDGSLLYNSEGAGAAWQLKERTRAGATRNIWSCPTAFGSGFECYSNTVNWNERDNTIFTSFPDEDTVAEINRTTGALVATYGAHTGSYAFSPTTYGFQFQHFANMSADGTLMISSHVLSHTDPYTLTANHHTFQEWTIDRPGRRLVQKWVYTDGPEFAMYKGEAVRLPNGNVLANYGTGGVIREITQDKQTVFYAKFDAPTGDDLNNKLLGHNVLIDDLYALNGGGPR